jgi:GTPase SAR1 family protein
MEESEFDVAHIRFEKFVKNLDQNTDFNEANTRFKIIDEIFDCLGWAKSDIVLEEAVHPGFADYIFSTTRKVLIVEAKKEGEYFTFPENNTKIVNLKSFTSNNTRLNNAIIQVEKYCQSSGIPYGVVTNGHQFLGFIASRTDGQEPETGKAIIFSSLDDALKDFVNFWNYFSKRGLTTHHMRTALLGKTRVTLPNRLSETIDDYPSVQRRNPLQHDLKIVSEIILEDLTHEDLEKKFLEDCYCESGALSKHSLLAKNIIENRYAQIQKENINSTQLIKIKTKDGISEDFLTRAVSRRPILLLGDVGVGKSTFIRKMIKVDAKQFFAKELAFHVDLGSETILNDDIKTAILRQLAKILLSDGIDINENTFVRAVYKNELSRFSHGTNEDLKELNAQEYKLREIDYLNGLQEDFAAHLGNSIKYVVEKRKKQMVIFLDNADQRNINDQQTVFLMSQEMAEQWPVTVFVSLRPETFNISSQEGVLAAYHSKAFTIDPPRIDDVLIKRLKFGIKLANGEIAVPSLDGSKLKLEQLRILLGVMIASLEYRQNKELPTFIENISYGNVREAIDMVKDFFGTGHINTEKIIRITEEDPEDTYIIRLHEFLRAVIYGDGVYFDPSTSIVTNLFDVHTKDIKEHFLLFVLLIFLDASSKSNNDKGFVPTDEIYNYLQSLGFLPDQIDQCMGRALDRKLIEADTVITLKNSFSGHSIRPTSSGLCHIKILVGKFTYIDAIVVDTPIFRAGFRNSIFDSSISILNRIQRAKNFARYLDAAFKESFFGCEDERVIDAWDAIVSSWQNDIEYIETTLNRRQQERTSS